MDDVQCPNCKSTRTEWTQDRVNRCWVMVCVDCGHHFPPPQRAQNQRAVADVQKAIDKRIWSEAGNS